MLLLGKTFQEVLMTKGTVIFLLQHQDFLINLKKTDNSDPENRFFRPDDRFNAIKIVTHSSEVIQDTLVLGNI